MNVRFYKCPDCAGRGWVYDWSEDGDPLNLHGRPDCGTCRRAGVLAWSDLVRLANRYLTASLAHPE
jgi:hypothetical protein